MPANGWLAWSAPLMVCPTSPARFRTPETRRQAPNYGYEVRRMLYFGPDSRRSGTPYRVLFTILPPPPDEDEAIIRVLRILHGAQRLAEPHNEAG